MNKLVLLFSLFASFNLFSIDRIVQQNGPVGTYASVGAAVTAAVDGDQIIINNRTDLLPWVENISINKSLTFLCATDNTPFWVEGNYTITMADNRSVTFNGMRNTNGSIFQTGTIPVFRTNVTIVQSEIVGNLNFGIGVNLLLSNTRSRMVYYTYGKIYGNDLQNLILTSDATSEDVNQIVGNRIGYLYAASGSSVSISNNTQYLFFSNNFCYNATTNDAMSVLSLKTGAVGNRIVNCTFWQNSSNQNPSFSASAVGLRLAASTGTLTVENCSMGGFYNSSTTGSNGLIQTAGVANTTLTYNMFHNMFTGGTAPSTTLGNFSSSAASYNVNADGSSSSAVTVNAGNPLNDYLDLDLSRNDIGCFGGSYSRENFWPMVNTQSSRVIFVTTPRVVNQGGTVNMTGTGIDE